MRLLKLDNDAGDEFSLVEFLGEDLPPYAILSHTWGPSDTEVSHKDLVEGTGKSKIGYEKIRACGMQTAEHNLKYFWVDTCCIDKTSSAELSEAINSMYHWYGKAEVCFAHLQNVPHDISVWDWQPAKIKWFTRGWTLQELLASKIVEFYASDWTYLGTKADLRYSISLVTGIHVSALTSRSVQTFSIAQRMSWASRRSTTRPEDIAYCLLGLFNVNMPLLYGEGARKAFVRLQEEIMKQSDDQSIFAWNQPDRDERLIHGLLADSPGDFALAGSIVPVQDLEVSNPYSMTNAGLRIALPMLLWLYDGPRRSPFRTVVLSCIVEAEPERLLSLRLYHLSDEGEQYGRVSLSRMWFSEPKDLHHGQLRSSQAETIYVRNDLTGHAVKTFEKRITWLAARKDQLCSWFSAWSLQRLEVVEVCVARLAASTGLTRHPGTIIRGLRNLCSRDPCGSKICLA